MRRGSGGWASRRGSAGRTLVELLVAMFVAGLAIAAAVFSQTAALRWWQADLRESRVARPVRDGGDMIARDIRHALRADAGPDHAPDALVLELQQGTQVLWVGYRLVGSELRRETYDPVSGALRRSVPAVVGVAGFDFAVDGSAVQVALSSLADGGRVYRTEQAISQRAGW